MSEQEDYRVKNAREGKAFYIPGRPVEEVKAEIAAKRKQENDAMPSHKFTAEENTRYLDALDEVVRCIDQAENVFALLARIQMEGDFDGHFGLSAMPALASKALASMADKEMEHLSELAARLRTAA